MKRPRFYLDTSVIGGCFDPEFMEGSTRLIEAVRQGQVVGVISEVVLEELAKAPPAVRAVLASLPPEFLEYVEFSVEAIELRNAYLTHGVLTPKSHYDATHVALATLEGVDAIVSWNFKHRFLKYETPFAL